MAEAWSAWSDGKIKSADTLAVKLLKVIPQHEHAWFLRGLCSARLGKHAQAIKQWEHVQHSPDLLPPLTQSKGVSYLSLGQTDLAVQQFQQALLYTPDHAQCHYLLGMATKLQGDLAEAQRSLRRAVLLDPQLAHAQFELGALLLQAGDAQRALNHFKAASPHLPNAPELHNNLGLCYQGLGQTANAVSSYRKAVELQPNYAEAWFNLGMCQGGPDAPEGQHALAKAFELNPELKAALNNA